jgi:hypothetical protein
MNDAAARRLIAACALAVVFAIGASGRADCPSLPETGHGVIGHGEPKSRIARVILEHLTTSMAAGGSGDVSSSFLSGIDYTAYLNAVSFKNDPDVTEGLRQALNERIPDLGDRFLLLVADTYYRDYPANFYKSRHLDPRGWLQVKTDIGVHYIDRLAKKYGASSAKVRALYELVGTYTLFQVASHIDVEIAAGRLDEGGLEPLLAELRRHGVPVGTKKGDLRKAWEYFARGDYEKLLQRGLDHTFLDRYKEIVQDVYNIQPAPSFCYVTIFDIMGRHLGRVATAYVMERRFVSASYSVRANGQGISVPPRALLAMSASYTDSDGVPDGFTVINGSVHNAALSRRMDALVAIRTGDIEVTDLRQGARCGTQPLQPFTSLPDYYCLLSCVTNGPHTLFQTHLLYAEGQPALDPATAPVRPGGKVARRERRILALTADRFIVVDIPPACTIAEGTFLLQQALRLLGVKSSEVRAAINLDTGSFDILDVFCPPGTLRHSKKLKSRDATNLLVFSLR